MIDGIGQEGDLFFLISRSEPDNLHAQDKFKKHWIKADLSNISSINIIAESIKIERMPVSDIISIINVILDTSIAACIKEIHVPALKDTDV